MNFNWIDNPIMRGMGRLADFIILNLLWVVCSIPIITIGASTTALYTVMLKLVKNEEGYIAKGFLKAFKENFKQSTIMWIIFLLISIVFVVDFVSIKLMSDEIGGILQILFLFMGALLAAWMVYAFALQARFVNTVKNTLKNAMILVFAKLPFTVLIVLLTVGPVLVTFLTVRTLVIGVMVWFFAGVSLVAWLNSYLLRFVFKKLEEGGEQESQKEEIS
ncbi:MAG: YesL family protein [Lachnospiraceae bacterium]|jgi:uncharacterized membrane protein YesL|nr:YesL family protein [Lachnospiraceae bacterium]